MTERCEGLNEKRTNAPPCDGGLEAASVALPGSANQRIARTPKGKRAPEHSTSTRCLCQTISVLPKPGNTLNSQGIQRSKGSCERRTSVRISPTITSHSSECYRCSSSKHP